MRKLEQSVEEISQEVCAKIIEIENSDAKRQGKTLKFQRLATSTLKKLGDDKRTKQERRLATSTRNRYVTLIRRSVEGLGLFHHDFGHHGERLKDRYPETALHANEILACKTPNEARKLKAKYLKEHSNDPNAYKYFKSWPIDHSFLKYMVLTSAERDTLSDEYQDILEQRKTSTVRINVPDYQKILETLINVDSKGVRGHATQARPYIELTIAVAMATGRRMAEILILGTFKPVSRNLIEFTGHAKKRQGSQTITSMIYTLVDSELVCQAVEDLRENPSLLATIEDVRSESTEVTFLSNLESKIASRINRSLKRIWGDEERSLKDARAIWARIVFETYFDVDPVWANKDEDIFWRTMLGHEDTETQMAYKSFKLDYGHDRAPITRLEALKSWTPSTNALQKMRDTLVAIMAHSPDIDVSAEGIASISTARKATVDKFMEEAKDYLAYPVRPPKAHFAASKTGDGLFKVTITVNGLVRLESEYKAETQTKAYEKAWQVFVEHHPEYKK